jgi:ribosomal protein L11 methyltransferase
MDWLEVSLTVNGELAEAVVDVLARFAPNSVATEQGVRHDNADAEGTADGPITVRAYLPMDGQIESTRLKIEESLHYLGMIQPLPPPGFRRVADQNWMEAWKQHYKPIAIGQRLMIVPAWLELKQPEKVQVKINPGMAFGTGTHPSTQLCLEFVEGALLPARASPHRTDAEFPQTFIDVGCGSGILSIAALKLGASSALGVDIDPESISNARENASLNGIGPELALGVGSLQEILEGKFPLKTATLVAANILAPVIVGLFAEGLAEVVEQGGVIILGGILESQAEAVLEAAQDAGLSLRDRRQMGDWVALVMQR